MKKIALLFIALVLTVINTAEAADNFLLLRQEYTKVGVKTFNVYDLGLEKVDFNLKYLTGPDGSWQFDPGLYYKPDCLGGIKVGGRYITNDVGQEFAGPGLAQAGNIASQFFSWEALCAFGTDNAPDFLDIYGFINMKSWKNFTLDIGGGFYHESTGFEAAYVQPRIKYNIYDYLTLFIMGEKKEVRKGGEWKGLQPTIFSGLIINF